MRRNWKAIETLSGLTDKELRQFSWDDIKHFYKVTLWDKGRICAYCDEEMKALTEATLDHIIPRYYGGRTRLANLQLMHGRCNGKKSNKLIKGWPGNWRKMTTPRRRQLSQEAKQ